MLVALVGATFAASVALVGARGMVGLVGARQFFLALVGAGRSLFARVWLAGAFFGFMFTFTAQVLLSFTRAPSRADGKSGWTAA